MLLIRLLYFEVCSDALLCLYPLLHRLDGDGFDTKLVVVFVTEPHASRLSPFISDWLELAHEEVGVVGELLVTWADQPLPLF